MGGTKNENESRNFENDEGLAIALFHSRGKHRSFPTLRFRLREPIVIWTKNKSTKKRILRLFHLLSPNVLPNGTKLL